MPKKKENMGTAEVPRFFAKKFDVLLDEANRFSVPASVLDIMRVHYDNDDMRFVLMPSLIDKSIKVYPRSVFEDKELPKLSEMDDLSEKGVTSKMYIFSLIDNPKTDNHGRIRISPELLEYADIADENGVIKSREISIVGQFDHLRIIGRVPFEQISKDSRTKADAAEVYRESAEKLKGQKDASGSNK